MVYDDFEKESFGCGSNFFIFAGVTYITQGGLKNNLIGFGELYKMGYAVYTKQ